MQDLVIIPMVTVPENNVSVRKSGSPGRLRDDVLNRNSRGHSHGVQLTAVALQLFAACIEMLSLRNPVLAGFLRVGSQSRDSSVICYTNAWPVS